MNSVDAVHPSLPVSAAASLRKRLVLIMLIGLALRLAVTPFNGIEGLLNADHVLCWEQGNVARSLVAGHGFGSPFVSTQPSAIMPPVFPLVVAFCFKFFGVHTVASIFAVHAFNCVISVLATIPVFLLALWNLFFRSLGVVDAPAVVGCVLDALSGAGSGTLAEFETMGWLRPVGWPYGAD